MTTGNLKAEVSAEWCGETRHFRLTVGGILELEQKCAAPFGTVFARVNSGDYHVTDLLQVVRLGLIGGGLSPRDAAAAMEMHAFPARPLAELHTVARIVLAAAVVGFEVAPLPGKRKAAARPPASMPQPSTGLPQ